MSKIDAVVMWVDGEDEIFLRQHANYSGTVAKSARKHEGKARHRDNGELNYCLRGIHTHMPWIDRIHIVTSGQVPAGLDMSHPKLNLVLHSDIFPDLAVLPTFNSFAIDACLHRIPGLTKRFIRFSDDFLTIGPVDRDMMLGEAGRGVYYMGPPAPDMNRVEDITGNYWRTMGFNRFALAGQGVVAAHVPLHVPQMRMLDVCTKIESVFRDDLARTRAARFRTDRDLSMLFAYPHYVAKQVQAPVDAENRHVHPALVYKTWHLARQALVGDAKQDWRAVFEAAQKADVAFLNVNDHLGEAPDPQDVTDYAHLLETVLPVPAPWEIS